MASNNNQNINPRPCVYNCGIQIYWNSSVNEYWEVFTKKKHICPNRGNKSSGTTTEIISNQTLSQHKEAIANWTGTCNKLANITQPTLVIVGTKDTGAPPVISIQITEQIPGAWLVQMKGGGHALMYQYPEQFNNIVEAFLENTNTL